MLFRLLVLFVFSFLLVHSLDVIAENGTTIHFNTPTFSGNKSPIIDGKIISYLGLLGTTAKDLQACDRVSPNVNVNQSIALLAPYGGCSTERHIEVAQNAGAVAVIVITDQVWKICRTTDVRSSHFKNNINAICISTQDFAELSKIMITNGNKDPPQPTIAVFGSDPSEYNTKLNRRLINFGTITFFIVYILLSALAVYRLVKFFVIEGYRFTIPKFLLAYVVYAGIVLAITVIDLQGYRDWYNTMQFQTIYYFFFSSAVLYIFIIFSAYVANILAKVSQHYKMLKIVNYVITGIFLVFFTISNIVFSVYGFSWNFGEVQSRAVIIIISIILGSCGLFFLFCSIILVTKLSSFVGLSSAKSQTRRKKYIFLSIILFVAFLNNFLGFSITVAIAFKSIQNDIQSFFLLYFLYNVTCVVWLILLLLVFNPKKNLGKPSNSSFNFKKSSTEPFQSSMH